MATAGGVDGDAVPGCGVEHGRPRWDGYGLLNRIDLGIAIEDPVPQVYASAAVVELRNLVGFGLVVAGYDGLPIRRWR